MKDRILAWSRSRGYEVGWAPLTVLDTVQADLEERRAAGEIDERFARECLDPAFSGFFGLNGAGPVWPRAAPSQRVGGCSSW